MFTRDRINSIRKLDILMSRDNIEESLNGYQQIPERKSTKPDFYIVWDSNAKQYSFKDPDEVDSKR